MINVRDVVEQTILVTVGAAALTRERAEAIVEELVRRGQIREEDARAIVEKVMARVRGEAASASGLRGRLEGGVQGAMRELGVVHRADVDELELRVAGLEHRVRLLEEAAPPGPLSAE